MSALDDYVEAGFKVFGIHGVDKKGVCGCGNPDCKALYKHPVIANWQKVPHWSDEQLETFEQLGHFRTGFGVLCAGRLIIDVDARNGGVASFAKLCADVPGAANAAFVVATGSGNGSEHHYFDLPEPMALVQHLPQYPGIDFKTSGYVIGAGSLHASGAVYERARGYPQDITPAPEDLIALLRKPERYRVSVDGGEADVSPDDVRELLGYVSPDCPYDQWIKIGMALHHTLQGGGFELWDAWSSTGTAYPGPGQLERHWHSFGKSANPAGYGTLLHYAREGGYCEPVTFEYEDDAPPPQHGDPLDTTGIDLCRPPGFVGELCAWINSQCLYPRENLAVAASLYAVSCLAGMRHYDELDDMTCNMIAFCVSGSGTGKEAINQAYLKIMRAAGIQAAVHGGFKSEQELMRNLIRHQAAFYSVDEMGLVLRKLDNAGKRGGAAYLEGLVGMIMSVYSKANGFLPITGDLKEEVRDKLRNELARAEKRLGDLPADSGSDMTRGRIESQCARLQSALATIDDGLDSPYLGIIGYTTPVTFNDLMTFEQATNGFMARAMIFSDLETNPKRKSGFSRAPMPESLAGAIRNLYAPGVYDMAYPDHRVERMGEKTPIPTTPDGVELLGQVYERFHALAEEHKGGTGLEAIPRRGYEIAAKVSLILALPGGVRTAEHILWGYAMARRDVELKVRMAYSTEHAEQSSGLAARVLSLVTGEHGETLGVICNRLRSTPKAQVEKLLADMVDKGMLRVVESVHPRSKAKVNRYFAIA
jgi:hypothetical protein